MLESCAAVMSHLSKNQVTDIHKKSGHPGIKRTLYFARIIDPTVSKELVKSVVRACEACQSIDPAPIHWGKRVSKHDLMLIDCGSFHFAVQWPLRQQDSIIVIRQLEVIFYE